jgi:hypothetical protein
MRIYVNIFVKTLAQLTLAVAIAAQGYAWATGADARVNFTTIGLGLLAAFIGAVVAVGHAYAGSPATTAVAKATRSAVQAFVGALGAVVLNSTADLANVTTVLAASAAAIVLAFVVTYLSYIPPLPEA